MWRFRVVFTLLLIVSAFSVLACAADAEQYVSGNPTEAVYVAWTSDAQGHLQGQIQIVSLDSPASTTTRRINAAFNGTRSGSEVSLVFGILSSFSGQTWTGHLGWRSLRLELPTNQEIALTAGSFTDFQQHVAVLQRSANISNVRSTITRNVQESAHEIYDARQSITRAVASLDAMFPMPPLPPDDPRTFHYKYEKVWSKMQNDWEKEKGETTVTPFTCYQKSKVAYVASTVSYDLSQVQYIDSQFSSFSNVADQRITSIREGITNIRNIYPIYKARFNAYQTIVSIDPDSAITARNMDQLERWIAQAIQRFSQRLSAAKAVQSDYDQKAHDLDKKATAFPDSLTCND